VIEQTSVAGCGTAFQPVVSWCVDLQRDWLQGFIQ